MFKTIRELHEEFQRHPQTSSGRLRLDHYLVLETTNEVTEHLVMEMEKVSWLPFTVTWVSEAGWRARLYQNPFEQCDMLNIPSRLFGMRFMLGSGEDCLVLNEADAILDREVGVLSEYAMQWFRISHALANTAAAYLGKPSELGPESCGYRQII